MTAENKTPKKDDELAGAPLATVTDEVKARDPVLRNLVETARKVDARLKAVAPNAGIKSLVDSHPMMAMEQMLVADGRIPEGKHLAWSSKKKLRQHVVTDGMIPILVDGEPVEVGTMTALLADTERSDRKNLAAAAHSRSLIQHEKAVGEANVEKLGNKVPPEA